MKIKGPHLMDLLQKNDPWHHSAKDHFYLNMKHYLPIAHILPNQMTINERNVC